MGKVTAEGNHMACLKLTLLFQHEAQGASLISCVTHGRTGAVMFTQPKVRKQQL